ncbi:MAG: lipase family protein [Symploca sp. SIO1B1]|nr:lipase family protein [Symploca sp. SIO1B1]
MAQQPLYENKEQQVPEITEQPNPQTAVMLASMAAVAYVPYEDDEVSKGKRLDEIKEKLMNRSLQTFLEDQKGNTGKHQKYIKRGIDWPLLKDFRTVGILSYDYLNLTNKITGQITGQTDKNKTFGGLVVARPLGMNKIEEIEILIAFRGTQSWTELAQDTNASTVGIPEQVKDSAVGINEIITLKVHSGFNHFFEPVVEEIGKAIFYAQKKFGTKKIKTIYITGHSLGGALSVLCAHHYMRQRADQLEYSEIPPINVYTFGSPRVGDNNFVWSFNNLLVKTNSASFRFYRPNDPVIQLPPERMGYKHVDIEYELPKAIGSSWFAYSTNKDHSIVLDRDRIYEKFGQQLQLNSLSYETSAFSRFRPDFAPTLANEPMLLNGQKVIFDKAVATTPVTIEPKNTPRQLYINKKSY